MSIRRAVVEDAAAIAELNLLMQGAHEAARAAGSTEIELDVGEFNEGALAFYDALGYRCVRRRFRYEL